jgi:hypothetical protein
MGFFSAKVDARRYSWPELRGSIDAKLNEGSYDGYEWAFNAVCATKPLPTLPEGVNEIITALAVLSVPESLLESWIQSLAYSWMYSFWASSMQPWNDADTVLMRDLLREDAEDIPTATRAHYPTNVLVTLLTSITDPPSRIRSYLDVIPSWTNTEMLREFIVNKSVQPIPSSISTVIDDRFNSMSPEQQAAWKTHLHTCFDIGRATVIPCILGDVKGIPGI